jgi:hypothetical protein
MYAVLVDLLECAAVTGHTCQDVWVGYVYTVAYRVAEIRSRHIHAFAIRDGFEPSAGFGSGTTLNDAPESLIWMVLDFGDCGIDVVVFKFFVQPAL